MDDSNVALQCSGKNSVGGRHQKIPQQHSCEPDAADELVPFAGARHSSTVDLDDGRQQRQKGRAHVSDALVHDEDVYRLNTRTATSL